MSTRGPYRDAAPTTEPPTPPPAPAPPPAPTVTAERAAQLAGLMHARHPWLAAAGIVLIVDMGFAMIAKREWREERFFLHSGTLGELDTWVAGLWDALGLASEFIAR